MNWKLWTATPLALALGLAVSHAVIPADRFAPPAFDDRADAETPDPGPAPVVPELSFDDDGAGR